TVTYTATDAASNSSSITHTYVVNVVPDTTAPVLSSTNQTFTTTAGTPLTLATITANDNVDGALTVTQTGTVDFNTVGTYTVTYTATDAASNSSSITHTYVVNVVPDTTAPVLSSTNQTFTTTAGTPLTLATVTANDAVDGSVTVTQTGTVDFNTVGTYTVTYSATDAASNSSSITHTYVVNAIPNTAPTASDGSTDLGILGFTYNGDLASYISDNESSDNQLTINVVSGPSHGTLVWNGTQFTYQATIGSGYFGNDSFTYNVTDPQGLTSSTQTFTIYNIIEF
ncbi:MAG: DUF5011 domain-containing protein, partial [Candidatus Gracilibacteria bacterium]|nr:DUF5011 domain-containing protein [Candidatus Gracilibacteria bacterium]